jgi:hypothetical protein
MTNRRITRFDTYIAVAADSLQKLKILDVERVIAWAPARDRAALAEYIAAQRPDLACEAQEVLVYMDTQ